MIEKQPSWFRQLGSLSCPRSTGNDETAGTRGGDGNDGLRRGVHRHQTVRKAVGAKQVRTGAAKSGMRIVECRDVNPDYQEGCVVITYVVTLTHGG